MDDFKIPSLPNAGIKPAKCSKDDESNEQLTPEVRKDVVVEAPYKVPPWSGSAPPDMHYKFEVLKSGQIIEEIDGLERQAIWKFGRLPQNDIEMAHPTISRFHAILQYRSNKATVESTTDENTTIDAPDGWYVYDLDSTHGTFLNKQRLPPRVFIRMHVGHMLKLGSSTRLYILLGPSEDEEPESEFSVTELREQRKAKEAKIVAEAERKAEEAREREHNEGISWGMSEDADEETDLTHNPYASTNNEELFLDDPKKTLRGYFEREDIPLEYKCDEMSTGCFVCRVELPIDDANGRPLIAEVVHKGKKKDCVVQCALEACRILDRYGVLRQSHQEPSRRKQQTKESDSDDDEFWDRTGAVERKRQRKANTIAAKALTYEDLQKMKIDLSEDLQKVTSKINEYKEQEKRLKSKNSSNEDLDSFMENLNDDSSSALDKTVIRKLRLEQQRIESESERVKRLLKITAPAVINITGNVTPAKTGDTTNKSKSTNKQMPMIGKRNQFSKFVMLNKPKPDLKKPKKDLASDEEELEEDEEEIQQNLPQKAATTEISNKTAEKKDSHLNSSADGINDTQTIPYKDEDVEQIQKLETIKELDGNEMQESGNIKKRRNRQRQRNKRQEVDIEELEEHESSEKYAKWVPPENQTGDGYTNLNAKYGY